MAVARISRVFKDISLSFDIHPITRDILALKNEVAINRAIKNIIITIPSERFFSIFGSDVKNSLFDFVDYGTASILQQQIEIAISNWEPRVTNVVVSVTPIPDENSFDITVTYDIIGQPIPSQTFNYILEATR